MQNKKRAALVTGTTLALVGGGIAFAAWTSTGTGTGSVTAGSEVDLTVEQSDTEAVSGLFPTGSKTITISVTNPNPYAVELDTLAWDGGVVADNSECDTTSVTAELAPGQALGDRIASDGTVSKEFVVSMAADADPDCQGATFTLDFDASAHSVA
ncbi:MAG TPA: hypothetical protein VLA97_18805 [Nocardioidaceae bacterium]|nr:hypothetical protein [Nocardioidaceae bacterium]